MLKSVPGLLSYFMFLISYFSLMFGVIGREETVTY